MTDMTENDKERDVVIIGGGPAGLTAAWELANQNIKPIVYEKLDRVGGISRTENYKGYYFDMGGHRFFSKSRYANEFWDTILGDDFLHRPRLSRIYYNGRFFNYPLKPFNVLSGLGFLQSVLIIISYLRWQIWPYKQEETFEEWVTNRFGKRLFETFFKSYTEKVWGIPCSELKADWAAQRIKDLSLRTAVISMFLKPNDKIKTLISEFRYPRRGPGMLWDCVREDVEKRGGKVQMESTVTGIYRDGYHITSVGVCQNGRQETIQGTDFISSMPITSFLWALNPPPPEEVINAASELRYRDFITVCLIVDKPDLFADNWIYIHDPSVLVGRIQNFKNWSPHMVPDDAKTSLGLEYFCNEGDELWTMADEDLIELGKREIEAIGLAKASEIHDGVVFRVEKTYPVYDHGYAHNLKVIKDYLAQFDNFQTIGRNGLHRYNNQDHAMLTGMLAVRNMLYGETNNLWIVNAEEEYHEEIHIDDTLVEEVLDIAEDAMTHVFPRLDPPAFGFSVGAVGGLALFVMTLALVFGGGESIGSYFGLLGQFFIGYEVTPVGSFIGLIWGFAVGFVGGYALAFLRNSVVLFYLSITLGSARRSVLSAFLEHV
jgi:protoporphyrinogen oxidase